MTVPNDLSSLTIKRDAGSKPSGGSRKLIGFVVLIALVGAGYSVWKWRQQAPLQVETALVSNVYPSQSLTLFNASGYVVAQRKASLASKASGRLEWLGVLEGSKVRAGEVVARLESRDIQASRDQAQANVQVALANLGQGQAELSEAENAFQRSEDLISKKFISASAHDGAVGRLAKARAALAGYQAAVVVARANLRVAEVALDQALIRAPFDGVVIARNANVGDTITPFSQALDSKGTVVTVADMSTLEVEADVGESSLSKIKVGQPCEIQLDAISGQRFEGIVNRIVPTMDRAKASILVKIKFVQPDARVLPDMSVKVAFLERKVDESDNKPVMAVPASAVIDVAGRKQVYVVENNKVTLKAVELGNAVANQIEVRGLEVGTRVVVRPSAELSDGRTVSMEAK